MKRAQHNALQTTGAVKHAIGTGAAWLFVLIFTVIALLPFYLMLIMGTYRTEDLFANFRFLPGTFLMENIRSIMQFDFLRYYGNSMFIAILSTGGSVFVSALAGFVFAKYQFRGRKLLFLLVVGALAVPVQLNLVGLVIEINFLGLTNSLLPLCFISMASPFAVFWMHQYIRSGVPNEILESGRIDGCNEWQSFFRLVFPILRPALIPVGLLQFVWSWNSYMGPLVLLSDVNKFTIPLAISLLNTEYRANLAAQILCLAISTIPMVILFACFSKYLIQGLVAGSVKG